MMSNTIIGMYVQKSRIQRLTTQLMSYQNGHIIVSIIIISSFSRSVVYFSTTFSFISANHYQVMEKLEAQAVGIASTLKTLASFRLLHAHVPLPPPKCNQVHTSMQGKRKSHFDSGLGSISRVVFVRGSTVLLHADYKGAG